MKSWLKAADLCQIHSYSGAARLPHTPDRGYKPTAHTQSARKLLPIGPFRAITNYIGRCQHLFAEARHRSGYLLNTTAYSPAWIRDPRWRIGRASLHALPSSVGFRRMMLARPGACRPLCRQHHQTHGSHETHNSPRRRYHLCLHSGRMWNAANLNDIVFEPTRGARKRLVFADFATLPVAGLMVAYAEQTKGLFLLRT